MPRNVHKERPHRDLLQIPDFSAKEIDRLFALAESMRAGKYKKKPLAGKSLAMIFMKSSTRTRVSFEVAAASAGAHPVALSSADLQLGRGETIEDTGRVLSRYVDAVVLRTFEQERLELLAGASSVPVINALSDFEHPCQCLADLLTVRETKGDLKGRTLVYLGDGNNVTHSLLLGCAKTVFPYVENHLFYVEHWFHSVFWNKMREVGVIMKEHGVIEDVDDIWKIILSNHRTPRATWGDLHAMISANASGAQRPRALADRGPARGPGPARRAPPPRAVARAGNARPLPARHDGRRGMAAGVVVDAAHRDLSPRRAAAHLLQPDVGPRSRPRGRSRCTG